MATAAPPSGPREIDARQTFFYHDNGYLVLRGVFAADEVAALAAEAETLWNRQELVDTANIRCRWQQMGDDCDCRFDCFDPIIDIGPVCRYFATDERMLAPLRAIYDDSAHLFKDKLIFKSPGAGGYGLHQDFIGWTSFPESFITALVAIDPTDAANGATEVYAGSHRRGYLSERDGEYHELDHAAFDPATRVTLELAPGDVALFGGFTAHWSGANNSDRWRRQLYLSYNAGRDGGDLRDAHYAEFHQWLVRKYAEYGKTGVYFR